MTNMYGKEEKSSYQQIWERFCAATSLHGFIELIRAEKGRKWRLFWWFLIAAGFGGAIYEIYKSVDNYLKTPVLTSYALKSAGSLNLPQIEICLRPGVSAKKIKEKRILPIDIDYMVNMKKDPGRKAMDEMSSKEFQIDTIVNQIFWPSDLTILSDHLTFYPTYEEAKEELEYLLSVGSFPELKQMPENFTYANLMHYSLHPLSKIEPNASHMNHLQKLLDERAFARFHTEFLKSFNVEHRNMPLEDRIIDIAMDLEEILLVCLVEESVVNCSDYFILIFDGNQGPCYFLKKKIIQFRQGDVLSIVVDMKAGKQHPGIPALEDGFNIKIQDEFEPFSKNFLVIPSGSVATIDLGLTRYRLTSGTGGSCLEDTTREFFKTNYTNSLCREECQQRSVFKRCQCIDVQPRWILLNESIPLCNTYRQREMCLLEVTSETDFFNEVEECSSKCKPPCNYNTYSVSLSTAPFPSRPLMEKIKRLHSSDLGNRTQDLTLVKISFGDLQYVEVTQSTAMTVDGFISQIGGTLGLFMGASLISIAQFLIFLCSLANAGNDHAVKVGNKK